MAREIVDEDALCSQLKELATDSNKYRAKKDRRQQRSSFRDILRTVEVSTMIKAVGCVVLNI